MILKSCSSSDREFFIIQGGPIKTGTHTFISNFTKCEPIFIILSPADSLVNLQHQYQTSDHTLQMSLHYLVKYQSSKNAVL